MEEKGLLSRSVSEQDARQRVITLTEKGAELREQVHQAFHESEELLMKGLSEEERDQLFACLERVIRNLEEDRSL
jgi:DNA-binding MarR family transcriptional regulator